MNGMNEFTSFFYNNENLLLMNEMEELETIHDKLSVKMMVYILSL